MTSQPGISWGNGSDPYFELGGWNLDNKNFRGIKKVIHIYFFEIWILLAFLGTFLPFYDATTRYILRKWEWPLFWARGMKLWQKLLKRDRKRNKILLFRNLNFLTFLPPDDVTSRYILRKWKWPLFWARGMKLRQKVLQRDRKGNQYLLFWNFIMVLRCS